MSYLKPLVMPNDQHAKREKETIEIVKALREKGFIETDYDKVKKERVFKKSGFSSFRISAKDGRVAFGSFSWVGNKYASAADFINKLITEEN